MSDIRETLERALERATVCTHVGACDVLRAAIAEALTQLSDMERDHEAMEKLRLVSLKRGWQWRWDGLYQLEQVPVEPSIETYKNPTDAILKSGQKIGAILGGRESSDD